MKKFLKVSALVLFSPVILSGGVIATFIIAFGIGFAVASEIVKTYLEQSN